MTCARCGRRNSAASWYCQGCGSSLINAQIGAGGWRDWRIWAAITVVAIAVAVMAVLRSGADAGPAPSTASSPAASDPVQSTSGDATSPATQAVNPATGAASSDGPSSSGAPSSPPLTSSIPGSADAPLNAGESATMTTSTASASTSSSAPLLPPGMSAFTATVVAAAMSGSDRLEGSQGNGTNGAAPPTLPAIPIHEGQQAWSAPLARTAPKLDGWLGDWPAAAIAISAIVAGGAQRNGPADASAEAHVLWTPDDLGIAVHVMDDNFLAPSEGPKLGDGDSIELQLDTDLIGDWTDGAYSPDDWRIGLSPGDLSGRASEAYVFWPEPARVLDGVRLASRRVGDGYTIEALIPWTSLGMKSRSLLPLGLALSVMDRDRAGAVPETIVSSSPNRRASDPRTFGTLVLAGDDGAGVIESGRPHSVGP